MASQRNYNRLWNLVNKGLASWVDYKVSPEEACDRAGIPWEVEVVNNRHRYLVRNIGGFSSWWTMVLLRGVETGKQ